VLYPILVYPKTAWADASDETTLAAIKELLDALKPKGSPEPAEPKAASQCPNCGPAFVLVRNLDDTMKCPDCQRAYREVVTASY
jgi:hypothetical protein